MIPSRFHRQRSLRPIDHRTVNQTQDDVRRLAITQSGPGFGSAGTPGGLITRLASTGVILGYTDPDGVTGLTITPPSPGDPDAPPATVLGRGNVYQVGLTLDDNGEATLATDEENPMQVYNLTGSPIAGGTYVFCCRAWGVFIAEPPDNIFECLVPSDGGPAATGSFPYTPKSFTADVYSTSLGGIKGTKVADDAKVWNDAPVALTAGKLVYLKSNPDGSYMVINQVC